LNSILNAFGLDGLDSIITHRSSDQALKDYQTKVIGLVTKLVKNWMSIIYSNQKSN